MAEVTAGKQNAFLEQFASCGSIRAACIAAQVGRTTVREWRDASPEFDARFHEAATIAAEVLEEEARRRGVAGLVRKKFDSKGNPIMDPDTGLQYVELEYSDRLLGQLLEGNIPEKYQRRRVEHTGKDGAPLQIDITQLTGEELVALRALLTKAGKASS